MSALAWLLPLVLPLLAAGLALVLDARRAWLPVLLPLPALVLALTGAPGPPPDLTWILLDLRLALPGPGRVLLAMTALVWFAGGLALRSRAADSAGLTAAWLVTLTGNLGVVLAGDVVTLYTLYATMTFAAYPLVIHERTTEALRAGRIYIVLAVIGEALLISGLILATARAGTTDLAGIAAALGADDRSAVVLALVVAGFAVKAGIVPLHVWLPLAHPAAPVPASAVLSGAMIKAGLIGWLRVLPLGADSGGVPDVVTLAGTAMISVGVLTALYGAVVGVVQTRAKVVLAYSSVSQMGLITTLVGTALVVPAAAPLAVAAAVTYALHHGLTKAALFLGVGVLAATTSSRQWRAVVVGMALAGLALAGAPLTSGYVAKSAMKKAVAELVGSAGLWDDARLTTALAIGAVGTTLLMVRMLVVLVRTYPEPRRSGSLASTQPASQGRSQQPNRGPMIAWGPLVAWAALLVVGLAAAWVLPAALLPELSVPRPSLSSSWQAVWPVLVGAGLALGAAAFARLRRGAPQPTAEPAIPAGDLVVVAEALLRPVARELHRSLTPLTAVRQAIRAIGSSIQRTVQPGQGFTRLDERLTRWRLAGVFLALLIGALALTLIAPSG